MFEEGGLSDKLALLTLYSEEYKRMERPCLNTKVIREDFEPLTR